MNIVVVIPAYNEEKAVGEVVRKCKMQNAECGIIVIDDGSSDRTAAVARAAGATVLCHPINRGLGAAISTGIEGALMLLCHPEVTLKDPALCENHGILRPAQNDRSGGVIVTLDADGQHDPAEIPGLVEPILKGEADIVIGSRFLHNPSRPPLTLRGGGDRKPSLKIRGGRGSYEIPFTRQVANWCGNIATWLLFGIWVTDSQSGFRAFAAAAAEKLRLRTSTMEVSSEIIREIARLKFRLVEIPVTVRYTVYSLAKGQNFRRGLETLWKLVVLRFFR